MPNKALHPCNKPGCSRITRDRFCPEHQREYDAKYDKERGSSYDRGYDLVHRRWRIMILNRDPICIICNVNPSTEAHHIDGNSGNREMENGMGLCKACHSTVTTNEQGRWGKEKSWKSNR